LLVSLLAFPEKSYFGRPPHVDQIVRLDRLSDNLEQFAENDAGRIPDADEGSCLSAGRQGVKE